MEDFNSEFIQPNLDNHTISTIEPENIPIIDIASAFTNSGPSDGLITKIKSSCEKWGFFQVINHGVSVEKREKLEFLAREFFALPLDEKNKVKRDEFDPMGYHDSEHTQDIRDWKEIFDFSVGNPTLIPASDDVTCHVIRELRNQWPVYPVNFKSACEEYAEEVVKLSYKLLELIAVSLGLCKDRFNAFFKDQTSFVRVNYYPPCPYPDLALGIGPHKDSGGLTVLAQDGVGGLQVKRKVDGKWIGLEPVPNAYIINVGDVFQVWSNDKYESVEHRVRLNPTKGRLSIPMFFNPAHYVMVKPLDELITENERAKYKEYNYGKFLARRRLTDFKKLNTENLQIRHFRLPD